MPFSEKVSPYVAPNFDLFSPARRSDPLGVILGAPLDGGQSYTPWIGLSTVREIALKHADKVGLVPVERLDDAEDEIGRWQNAAEQAQARVAELEATQDRIAGLARDGFKVQKVMGRPKAGE
jgi:hypothetical protein